MRHHAGVATRILTVEDDERIRTAVRMALEDEGWEVVEAESGEDAVDQWAAAPADVVLIDLMLPGMDGFTAEGACALVACRELCVGLADGLHYCTGQGPGRDALLAAYADC